MSSKRIENILAQMTEDGHLKHGSFIPVEKFEELFDFKRDRQEFSWLISNIRTALYTRGLYLSGEGLEQTGGYSILPAQENFYQAKLRMARAERDLSGMETLLVNTDISNFSALQLARHEGTMRTVSLRLAALRKIQDFREKSQRRKKEILGDEEPQ